MINMKLDDLLKLKKEVDRIMNSNLSWEAKYDLIFSDEISKKIRLDYYDPDTSYEEDVMAWCGAFNNYINEI